MSKQYGVFNSYMNSFLSKILENEDLCKLLHYNTSDDIIAKPNLTQEQKIALIGTNIFINQRVPLCQDSAKTLLLLRIVDISYAGKKSSNVNSIKLACYMICADGVIRTENGARDLCMVYALDKTFENDKSGDIGIGQLQKYKTTDITDLGTLYQGYVSTYIITDFNTERFINQWT